VAFGRNRMAPVCNITPDSDVILGKLLYSSEHLDALICLIVARLVNGKKYHECAKINSIELYT
jgi:hypothetical protein